MQYRHFLDLKMEHGDWSSTAFSPSAALDEVWHAHLSFVDRYQRDIFALTKGAHRVIEHSPVPGPEAFDRYGAAYKAHGVRMQQRGETVDREFWPSPASVRQNYRVSHDGDSDVHLYSDSPIQCA